MSNIFLKYCKFFFDFFQIYDMIEYYKRIYNIFSQNILMDRTNNLSIQLSFFNSVPQEDDFSGKGQVVKLELFNNHSLIHGIMLKTTDSEEQLFQYVWLLVVNHFIDNNYGKDNKIKINDFKNSTRSFKYLLSDIKKNNEPIARANFTLTYNKQDYDEMLHYLVLNHNNYHNNTELIQNMRNYIVEYPLNNSSNIITIFLPAATSLATNFTRNTSA